jgi:type I restriction enzyme S subunit
MANEWPTVRIEDIAEKIAMGIHLDDGDFNFVTDEHAKRMKNSNVFRGDIIFTHAGNIGQVAYIPSNSQYERYVISQRQFYLRCDLSKAAPAFISYFFHSNEGQHKLLANASQTGVPSIARPSSYLKTIELSLPPLTEQRAIAHILGTLDDKIELNRRANETLEAMARALFKAWFVDFEPVCAKLEGRWQCGQSLPGLPAHLYDLFPARLVDSELGEIPEGWESVPASRLVEFNPSEPLRKETEAPYIEMAALPTFGSWPEPPVLRPFGSGMRFRNGDTLLARITPCLENGKTAFVQCLPDNTVGWGSTEYIVMRPKLPVPQEFGYLLARDAAFREQAIRSMTGTSGRQRVQADSVAAFRLAAPSNEAVWDAFSRIVAPTFMSIKANAEAIATLAQLRNTLLPKLISGELRVPDVERIVGA